MIRSSWSGSWSVNLVPASSMNCSTLVPFLKMSSSWSNVLPSLFSPVCQLDAAHPSIARKSCSTEYPSFSRARTLEIRSGVSRAPFLSHVRFQ